MRVTPLARAIIVTLASFEPVAAQCPTPTTTSSTTTTTFPCAPGGPSIVFTHVPPYGAGDTDRLRGQVCNVSVDDYKVTVYIYVETCTVGWWGPKPYWDFPLTTIAADGSWTTNIVTGGCDQEATRIVAYVIPNGYDPPDIGNASTLA